MTPFPQDAFSPLFNEIKSLVAQGLIPARYGEILVPFFRSYCTVLQEKQVPTNNVLSLLKTFLALIQQQCAAPHPFDPLHRAIRSPFDYYQFGLDFFRPLVDVAASTVAGLSSLKALLSQLSHGDNVIFFANHQIEADPQAISILLCDHAPDFAEHLFFVAGSRVTSDPLAIPFSMGRNLICIYSKKYIATPKEQQRAKQLHNKRTLEQMVALLHEGGHAIYVAPSGGRDRIDPTTGKITLAPFDPQSIELFYLMTKKARRKTHFYPLALSTYHLLPPPDTIEETLGEYRTTGCSPIHLAFGNAIDMEHFPGAHKASDKKERKAKRAHAIWKEVKNAYLRFPE